MTDAAPLLLQLDRGECERLNKLAQSPNGEASEAARRILTTLWDSTPDPVPCFVCDDTIVRPVRSVFVGDLDPAKVAIAPLCATCFFHPARTSKVLKLMRVLHRAKTGKDIHYQMTPLHRRHGRGPRR